MEFNTKKHLNYTIHYFIPWRDAEVLTNTILKEKYQVTKTLNNSSRSRVDIIQVDDELLILKKPLEKNIKKWIRFTTLMRKSEALQSCLSMQRLQKIGVVTNKPLIVLEKHRMGMVIDSWFVFSYLSGNACVKEDYPEVIDTLNTIHQSGYLHGDPQIHNFLTNQNKVQVIDAKISSAWNNVLKQKELIYLEKSIPEGSQYFNKSLISYKVAILMIRMTYSFRYIKHKIRSFFKL